MGVGLPTKCGTSEILVLKNREGGTGEASAAEINYIFRWSTRGVCAVLVKF